MQWDAAPIWEFPKQIRAEYEVASGGLVPTTCGQTPLQKAGNSQAKIITKNMGKLVYMDTLKFCVVSHIVLLK